MALNSPVTLPNKWDDWAFGTFVQRMPYIVSVAVVIVVAYIFNSPDHNLKSIPIINPTGKFFFTNADAKRDFINSSKKLLAKARTLYPKKPYRINTDLGQVIMLPPHFADEIRNEPRLSFAAAMYNDFHGHIPGFQTFALGSSDDQILQVVTRKQLTKSLAQVTQPLSEEAAISLSIILGDNTEWTEITTKTAVLELIARLSSRVFLGDQLCRNKEWLRITQDYTLDTFIGATKLRLYPRPIRRLAHWIIPECKKLRAEYEEARRLITPVIKERERIRQKAIDEGNPVPRFNDALDWATEEAAVKGVDYDAATFQLLLSLVAIHTSSDLLTQVMLDLARNGELFQPLREEIVETLRSDGWNKTSLYKMKLLDSVIKESQRMKPSSIASMRRRVQKDLKLSDGLVLKTGMRVNVDSYSMQDPAVHENPEQWDGYRFLRMREQPGKSNMAQLVATHQDHIAFGHGEHACPGRFFAANEIKVAMCHLLMKYDWKLVPGADTTPGSLGLLAISNPTAKILVRRRERVELDIDSI